jgi:hypothetical protein
LGQWLRLATTKPWLAGRVVSVPMNLPMQRAHQTFMTLTAILLVVFVIMRASESQVG